jgi:hypothetical protein
MLIHIQTTLYRLLYIQLYYGKVYYTHVATEGVWIQDIHVHVRALVAGILKHITIDGRTVEKRCTV